MLRSREGPGHLEIFEGVVGSGLDIVLVVALASQTLALLEVSQVSLLADLERKLKVVGVDLDEHALVDEARHAEMRRPKGLADDEVTLEEEVGKGGLAPELLVARAAAWVRPLLTMLVWHCVPVPRRVARRESQTDDVLNVAVQVGVVGEDG